MTVSRPTLTRLYDATGGNPMACLEIGRALQRLAGEPLPGEPLPVPTDLRERSWRTASATCRPDTRRAVADLCRRSPGRPSHAAVAGPERHAIQRALDEAQQARIVTSRRRPDPVHPSVAGIRPVRRPHSDRADGGCTTAREPRHRAGGAARDMPPLVRDGPDPDVAAALEVAAERAATAAAPRGRAAGRARGRADPGGPASRTCSGGIRCRRRIFRLGDPAGLRARRHAADRLTGPGLTRVRGLLLLADDRVLDPG